MEYCGLVSNCKTRPTRQLTGIIEIIDVESFNVGDSCIRSVHSAQQEGRFHTGQLLLRH